MSTKTREVGGGPATGLAEELIAMLQGGLTGTFGAGPLGNQARRAEQTSPGPGAAAGGMAGADPMASTAGIAGVLNDLLAGGAGNLGGSLGELINRDTERNANALRARFGAEGGTAFGTPAAFAESLFRSEAAPRAATAIGGLQMSALQPILQLMTGLAGKGITQRETVAQPSPWASAAAIAAPIIGTLAAGPAGGAIGSSLAGLFSGGVGGGGGGGGGASFLGPAANSFFGGGGGNRPFSLPPVHFGVPSLQTM